jgi:hypothetical protein
LNHFADFSAMFRFIKLFIEPFPLAIQPILVQSVNLRAENPA